LFNSKIREIVIPQAEHAKLSGILANSWGNEEIDKPALDFDSFVEGVTHHDMAYGDNDNFPLGELSLEHWTDLTLKGTKVRFENPVVDIVTKLHLKRLLGDDNVKKRKEILNNIEQRIEERLLLTNNSIEEFLWADRITNFCDWVSFNFCLEHDFEDKVEMYTCRNSKVKIKIAFQTNPAGEITVHPWPFSVDEINGHITAFEKEGYPKILKPKMKGYFIKKNPSQ